jgi:hypothetical protein
MILKGLLQTIWLGLVGWGIVMVARSYAPQPNPYESVLVDKCLAAKGFPLLDGWTGHMMGCER